MRRAQRLLMALVLALPLAGASTAAGTALVSADYGSNAVRQVEISANSGGPSGGGVWLWIELDQGGTGTYAGSDCGHGGQGTASDKGQVTWLPDGNTITISGVQLNALPPFLQPAYISVPWSTGHVTEPLGSVLVGLPFPGTAQVQVAP
jgi:hypothetical protein